MTDPQRPRYHFLPPRGWMNDPNGLIFTGGRYHLFYQYNPHGNVWNGIHWGHASSVDLLYWQHHPLALAPEPGGIDAGGVFSGCAVMNGATPTLLYTAHRFLSGGAEHQALALATSDAQMLEWVKHPANPLLEADSAPWALTGFRDPFVWREGELWHLAVGAGLEYGPGLVLHYTSPDLLEWTYRGELLRAELEADLKPEPGTAPGLAARLGFWECPCFFALEDRSSALEALAHVLMVSRIPQRDVRYFVGDYDGLSLHPKWEGRMDAGECFYAPQTFHDAAGRVLCFGWLLEHGPSGLGYPRLDSDWNGVMSLPRVLTLERGRLVQRPAPELEGLRESGVLDREFQNESDSLEVLPYCGDALELVIEIALEGLEFWEVRLRRSPDGLEETRLSFDVAGGTLCLDTRRSSLAWPPDQERQPITLQLERTDPLELHIFLDASTLEVFVQGQALSARMYPTRADSLGLALLARGHAPSTHLKIWSLERVNVDES